MTDEYTKQLEAHIEKLQARLDESILKAECYDLIMRNISSLHQHKKDARIHYSYADGTETQIISIIDGTKDLSTPSARKIASDFLQAEEAAKELEASVDRMAKAGMESLRRMGII
jgi:hypothetical protein